MSFMGDIKKLLNFSIVNIDKPAGPTSFSVSEYVARKLKKYGIKKTSHFGTLDPKVTGVLPIALGRACKLTGYFLGHDKVYVGILHTHSEQDIKELQKIIDDNFVGKIKQTPPVRSSVKRAERIREVYRWDLLEVEGNDEIGKDFLFVAEVEGGTYIRKLCSDLGEIVGGAHMDELRRTRAGIFSEEEKLIKLEDFDEAIEGLEKGNEEKLRNILTPADEAIKKIMPVVQVEKDCVKHLLTGKGLFKGSILGDVPAEGFFAVFQGNKFIEIAQRVKERRNGKEVAGKPAFVFN